MEHQNGGVKHPFIEFKGHKAGAQQECNRHNEASKTDGMHFMEMSSRHIRTKKSRCKSDIIHEVCQKKGVCSILTMLTKKVSWFYRNVNMQNTLKESRSYKLYRIYRCEFGDSNHRLHLPRALSSLRVAVVRSLQILRTLPKDFSRL